MAIARHGIQRVVLWNKANTGANPVALWHRKPASLVISDKTDVKDYRNRVIPGMRNVKFEATEYGVGLPLLRQLDLLVKGASNNGGGASAEFIGVKTAAATYDGVYQLVGANHMGLDFEYGITMKERMAKITLEASYEASVMDAILNAAVAQSPSTVHGLSIADYKPEYLREPNFYTLTYYDGATYAAFDKDELLDLSFTVKTKGSKSVYDRTIVSGYDIELKATIADAGKAEIKEYNLFGRNFSIKLTMVNPGGAVEIHVFDANVLSLANSYEIGDEKRQIVLTYTGHVVPANLDYATSYYGSTGHIYKYYL